MKKFNSVLYIYSNMDSSSQILLFLIILVALMLISILVINHVTKKKNDKLLLKDSAKRKISILKQKINDSNDDIKPLVDLKNPNKKKIDIKENIKEDKKDNIIEEEIQNEPKQVEEQREEVVEVVSKKTSIDDITKLIENTLVQEPICLTKFEEDQEQNAIISYDELVKRAGAKKIIYKCEEENNILDKVDKNAVIPENTVKQEINAKPKKFQASKVISPVFGVKKEIEEKDEVLETFIDLEEFPFSEKKGNKTESQKDMEFLTSLKEFRSGLD